MSNDTPESLAAILAEMRDPCAPRAPSLPALADRIEAALKRQNHCEKRFDENGDEMPPHCAFQSLRLDHALAENGDLRAALVEISQMCGVGPNEVSAIAIAHICDKALRTKGE